MEPTQSDLPPLPRATLGATGPLPDDPDLAAGVAAWPELPEAIKAGIVAMVKAAQGGSQANQPHSQTMVSKTTR